MFDDLNGRIDLILDGGPTDVGIESTVLDLSIDVPTICAGAISREMLQGILPRVEQEIVAERALSAMPSPGMLERHYSPRAPLTLYRGAARQAVARLIGDTRRP